MLSSLAPQHLEQSKKSFHFRVRVTMAKNRNKKRNGLAAMDVSTDQTVMDAQAMDTSESVAPAMLMGGGGRRGSLQVRRRGWRREFAGPHLQSFTSIVSF
ncbi:hypothetical protein KY285_026722 [Solanum tuberosum]|nr:hypothetical protein KY285_026722 [Solanum tuberosum]